jgi:hypothetical protein
MIQISGELFFPFQQLLGVQIHHVGDNEKHSHRRFGRH